MPCSTKNARTTLGSKRRSRLLAGMRQHFRMPLFAQSMIVRGQTPASFATWPVFSILPQVDFTDVYCSRLRSFVNRATIAAMPKVTRLPITRYDLPSIIDQRGYKVGAEIGVDHGYFSYYLLKHSKLDLLYSIDAFEGKWSHLRHEAQSHLSEFGNRSCVMAMPSLIAAAVVRDKYSRLDFVYIDGNHRFGAVRADLAEWSQWITPGGMIAGHDYILARGCGVIAAVNRFADLRGLEVSITREPWATWMITL